MWPRQVARNSPVVEPQIFTVRSRLAVAIRDPRGAYATATTVPW
ncbi:MAG: hypothetical protein R3B09_09305 [Nannocystaceae bacterium]